MKNIFEMTSLELGQAIKEKEISVKTVLDVYFERIELLESKVHSFNLVLKENAYKRAEEVQEKIDNGILKGSLAGVPIAIKDNICQKGVRTTCSSKILENFEPVYDAEVVKRLEKEGMIIIGKLNMDEFAMGSTTETSCTGATKNPWDLGCVPGGSSGGAAASVAARQVPVSLGSDTGGSIRQPCSYCGVTGLKPTYSAVSRRGLIAYASSLDQIGPIGKCAEDAAAVFSVICGRDELDGTSADFEFNLKNALTADIKGKKIGIPSDYLANGIDEQVKTEILKAKKLFEELGASVEEFSMPIVKYAVPAYYIIACAEACSNLSRYDGIKYGYKSENANNLRDTYIKSRSEGFGMEVKKRIMLGNFVLSSGYYDAYYNKALKAKALIQKAFYDAFEKYDMILGPVSPITAPKLGDSLNDPLKMYLGDIYTVMINISGLPSLAFPVGFSSENHPIGAQLIGKPFAEAELFSAVRAFETVNDSHKKNVEVD